MVDLLCISDAEATRALRFYKWDLTKLQVSHSGRCIFPAAGAVQRQAALCGCLRHEHEGVLDLLGSQLPCLDDALCIATRGAATPAAMPG